MLTNNIALLQAESSAVLADRFLAGRYGTLLMKGLEELFGVETVSISKKGRKDARAIVLSMGFVTGFC